MKLERYERRRVFSRPMHSFCTQHIQTQMHHPDSAAGELWNRSLKPCPSPAAYRQNSRSAYSLDLDYHDFHSNSLNLHKAALEASPFLLEDSRSLHGGLSFRSARLSSCSDLYRRVAPRVQKARCMEMRFAAWAKKHRHTTSGWRWCRGCQC